MSNYEIQRGEDKQTVQAESAYAAMADYIKHSAGSNRAFVLLYTEHDKNDGWDVFIKEAEMFKKPRFAFIKKLRAADTLK